MNGTELALSAPDVAATDVTSSSTSSLSTRHQTEDRLSPRAPRTVRLAKGGQGFGFNIVGGEDADSSIFISFILAGSPADVCGELRRADQIISVNDTDLRHASHDAAAAALKGAEGTVRLVVQYKPEEFNRYEARLHEIQQTMTLVHALPKRSLYVCAHFDYDPALDDGLPSHGLPFTYGDILHVINASDDECWQATKVLPNGDEEGLGIIPSKHRWERKMGKKNRRLQFHNGLTNSLDSKISSVCVNKSGIPVPAAVDGGNKIAFSRKFPFMKSRERLNRLDDKDMSSDAEGNGRINNGNNCKLLSVLTYEPVQEIDLEFTRPVIVLGLLKDRINDDLMHEFPEQFELCVPHTTRLKCEHEVDGRDNYLIESAEQMERDFEGHKLIKAGQNNDNIYETVVQSVMDVAQTGRHCILDMSANTIKRLHMAQLYPIIIFLRPKSVESVIEMNKRISADQARKTYEQVLKLEQDFGEYFTAIVSGDTPEEFYERTKEVIREQSGSTIWVPSKEKL